MDQRQQQQPQPQSQQQGQQQPQQQGPPQTEQAYKPQEPKRTDFKVASEYMGEKKVLGPVSYYSGLLKVIGMSKSRYLTIDLDTFKVFTVSERTDKPDPKEIFDIKDIKSIEVNSKKKDMDTFYMYIHTTDDKKKFKFRNSSAFTNACNAFKSIQDADGKRVFDIVDKNSDKDSHDSSDDEAHKNKKATNDDINRAPGAMSQTQDHKSIMKPGTEHDRAAAPRNETGDSRSGEKDSKPDSQKKDEIKEPSSKMALDGAKVREAHKHDEEYQYLKWKYIDRFEPNAPALPEHLYKFKERDTNPMAPKDTEKKTLEDKHKEYHGEELKADENNKDGYQRTNATSQQFRRENEMGTQSGARGSKDTDTTMTVGSTNQTNNLQSPTDANRDERNMRSGNDRDQRDNMNQQDRSGQQFDNQQRDQDRQYSDQQQYGNQQRYQDNQYSGQQQKGYMQREQEGQYSGQQQYGNQQGDQDRQYADQQYGNQQRDQDRQNLGQQQFGTQQYDQQRQNTDPNQFQGQYNNQDANPNQQSGDQPHKWEPKSGKVHLMHIHHADQGTNHGPNQGDTQFINQGAPQGTNYGPNQGVNKIRPGTSEWKTRERELEEREKALADRERELKDKERDLHTRKIDLKGRQLDQKEQHLQSKEQELSTLESEISGIQQELGMISQQRNDQREERNQYRADEQQSYGQNNYNPRE